MALPGNPTVNLLCGHVLDLGFVYDLEEWASNFIEQEFTCPICSQKGLYSQENLVLKPAKIPPQK